MCVPAGRRAISGWPRKFSTMNKSQDGTRRALGKGLTALLPARPAAHPVEAAKPAEEQAAQLPIEAIDPNPLQPRRVFQNERLEELAQSIRANGIIQPLVVRKKGERYQLVAGERRWRAAKLAGLAQVPAVVQENPIETAQAFERLSRDLGLSHEEIGRRTGKERTTITNLIRLLQLPPDLQQLLAEHRLSSGHARCLLSLPTAD